MLQPKLGEQMMRIISIRDDLEQAVLQYVRAIPDVFMTYDIASVELVAYDDDRGFVAQYDIVFVESDDTELVIGDAQVGTDLILEVDIYSDEIED
jgi:hypothetical protein